MSNTTPTPNDILRLFLENDQEDSPELTIVESSEWEQDHKYQCRETVVHHVASDTFWEFGESRAGSYHTDWYYNDLDEPDQVFKKEVTTTIWVLLPEVTAHVDPLVPFVNEALPL